MYVLMPGGWRRGEGGVAGTGEGVFKAGSAPENSGSAVPKLWWSHPLPRRSPWLMSVQGVHPSHASPAYTMDLQDLDTRG